MTRPAGSPASAVRVNDLELSVDLSDGRTITVPTAWFPRLAHGSPAERAKWRIIRRGQGIHWPDLDEDVSVESLLTGRRSRESDNCSGSGWRAARLADARLTARPSVFRLALQTVSDGFRVCCLASVQSRQSASELLVEFSQLSGAGDVRRLTVRHRYYAFARGVKFSEAESMQ